MAKNKAKNEAVDETREEAPEKPKLKSKVYLAELDRLQLELSKLQEWVKARGLKGVEDFPKITEALRQRGYKKKEIRKILGGNFVRVLTANEK